MPWDEDSADEEWVEDEDPGDEMLECPSCRQEVHEDTQQCPHCGDWITPAYPGGRSRQWAWAGVAILLIFSMILWTML